jgi:hypothetical protein
MLLNPYKYGSYRFVSVQVVHILHSEGIKYLVKRPEQRREEKWEAVFKRKLRSLKREKGVLFATPQSWCRNLLPGYHYCVNINPRD